MTLSGTRSIYWVPKKNDVLIPLLVDDPLWAILGIMEDYVLDKVLIPLLVDDPLWALHQRIN